MDTGYPALIADPLTIPNSQKITRTPDPEEDQLLQQNSCTDRLTSHTHSTQVIDITPKTFSFPSGTSEKACPEQCGMRCQRRSSLS